MSTALIVLGGVAFIALSIFFKFTPKLRVIVGLIVGSKIAGATANNVNKWIAKAFRSIAGPIGEWIGQPQDQVTLAIPGVLALILGVVVVATVFGKSGKGGKNGKSGKGGSMIDVALGCAIVLPITLGGLAQALAAQS